MQLLPLHDLPTRSASGFIIRYVLPRSIPPQLVGPLDRKASFSTLPMGDLIIAVGHGSPDELCGYNNEVILDTSSIPDVKNKVVVLISCETAQRLGPSLIDAGVISYIGFKDDLLWVCDSDLASTPWSDKLALTVMGPITNCVNGILDGKTIGEAYGRMLEEFSGNAEIEEDELVKSLIEFNRSNAVLLGDGSTRVRARPKIMLPLPPPPIILPLRA